MIQEYYRQIRKFGCNILAVLQQYDVIKDSPVRGAMIGNSKMSTTVGFQSVAYGDYASAVAQSNLFRFTLSASAPAGNVNRKKGNDAMVEMSEIRNGGNKRTRQMRT